MKTSLQEISALAYSIHKQAIKDGHFRRAEASRRIRESCIFLLAQANDNTESCEYTFTLEMLRGQIITLMLSSDSFGGLSYLN